MQTFLPYDDFRRSASCLDMRRLGKQRVEAKQLLAALRGNSTGWVNHPATKMWRGCESCLRLYKDAMIHEWVDRGYKNTMPLTSDINHDLVTPLWIGDPDFHDRHKSQLLAKDPEWYEQFEWDVEPGLPYLWPIVAEDGSYTLREI